MLIGCINAAKQMLTKEKVKEYTDDTKTKALEIAQNVKNEISNGTYNKTAANAIDTASAVMHMRTAGNK